MKVQEQVGNGEIIQQLLNAMIGGAMLIMPLQFNDSGLFYSLIVLVISCLINYTTCKMYLIHMRDDEHEIHQIIHRILGERWHKLYCFIQVFYLFLTQIYFFSLIVDLEFQFAHFFLGSDSVAQKQDLTISKLGIVWITIITIIPITILIFLKETKFFTKMIYYGVYCVYFYLVFIAYFFLDSIFDSKIHSSVNFNFSISTQNLGSLASTCSIAFTIHIAFMSILRQNPDKKQYPKNLKNAFVCGFLVYLFIGIFGSIAIQGRIPYINPPQQVTEYLPPTNIFPILISMLYFINILTVVPCYFDFFRNSLKIFLYQNKTVSQVPQHFDTYLNFTYIILAILVRLLPMINTNDLIAANGSISCFFLIFFFPILTHYNCTYAGKGYKYYIQNEQKTLLNEQLFFSQNIFSKNQFSTNQTKFTNQIQNEQTENDNLSDSSSETINQMHDPKQQKKQKFNEKKIQIGILRDCNDHTEFQQKNLFFVLIQNGFIIFYGLIIMALGINNIIS